MSVILPQDPYVIAALETVDNCLYSREVPDYTD